MFPIIYIYIMAGS